MIRIVLTMTLLGGCVAGFDPRAQTYTCGDDTDCASGYRCVGTGAERACAPADSRDGDAAEGADADAETGDAVHPLLVETGVTFATTGDHLVQLGAIGKHFFVAPDAMTHAAAAAYCDARSADGLGWRLAKMAELQALSRCCLTRPEQSEPSCSGAPSCFFPSRCAMTPACGGCGAPPAGEACWWDPSFNAECGTYWIEGQNACAEVAFGFDFGISEIVVLDPSVEQRVICTAREP